MPHPEVSLLQSAINEVTESMAIEDGSAEVGKSFLAVSSGKIDLDDFLDVTQSYCKTAEKTLRSRGEEIKHDAESKFNSLVGKIETGLSDLLPEKWTEKLGVKKLESIKFDDPKGVLSPQEYCVHLAVEIAQAKARGDENAAAEYLKELDTPFGDCDAHFITDIATRYGDFLVKSHLFGDKIPYRVYQDINDYVIEDKLPANARIAIIGDWGTGQDAALELLRQVERKQPDVVIHLGDIYYSGTQYEVDNYFTKPFNDTFQSKKPAVFNLTGNHDMYSGGQAYYNLIDTLGQPSSYFCLRNADWQFLAMDTGYNARLGGGNTFLQDTEVAWLKDKINNFNGRTVLLSHHQLFSLDDDFGGKEYNEQLHGQLEDVLDKIDIWFWGHEHNMFIFEDFMNLKRGCCLGASAFPVGKDEIDKGHKWNIPFVSEAILGLGADTPFYQHSYAIMDLDGNAATIGYFQDSDENNVLYKQII